MKRTCRADWHGKRCGKGEHADGGTRLLLVADCLEKLVLAQVVDDLGSFSGRFRTISGASEEALRATAELGAAL